MGSDILVIGINYSPELTGIGPYTAGMAEHYARAGHRVRVVTGLPHYPQWRHLPCEPAPSRENPDVHRYRHFIPSQPSTLGRTLYETTWFASASRALAASRCDVAIGVIPSLLGGVLAALAARRYRVPVGLVVKDLMGPAAAESGYPGGNRVAGATTALEQFLLRRADAVAIISDAFTPYLEKAGVSVERIHKVRDWNHSQPPTDAAPALRAHLGWGDQFVCLHAGNMGMKQELDTVLHAAALLRPAGIRVVLAGAGNDRKRLIEMAERMRLDNVQFLDLQASGQYEAMLGAADVLILNQRASVSEMALPCKLASYFAAGRPVVAAAHPDSGAAREIRDSGGGVVVGPGQPQALAEAVLSLQASPGAAAAKGSSGQLYATRTLSAGPALEQYDRFLQSLLGMGAHRSPPRGAPSSRR